MSFARKFIYQLTGSFFKLLLLLLPVVFALTLVLGNPDSVKKVLKQSGAYDKFVDVTLDNSQKEADDPQTKQLLSDPEIRSVIEQSIPPELLARSTEPVIQGFYDWLQGKTDEPQFSIDLSEAKDSLAINLGAYAEKRAEGLPICTLQQLRTVDFNNFLALPCRPPGTSPQQIGQQFSQQLVGDAKFLNDPVITNETIAKDNNGRTFGSDTNEIPKIYQAVQAGKWVLLGLAIGLALILVFAHRDRRAGVRHVAWALLLAGVFFAILIVVYALTFGRAPSLEGTNSIAALQLEAAKVLITDLNKITMWFAGAYIAIGGGLLLYLRKGSSPKAGESLVGAQLRQKSR